METFWSGIAGNCHAESGSCRLQARMSHIDSQCFLVSGIPIHVLCDCKLRHWMM